MERNFTDENFEEFLRQNADGLRMRPSIDVWKNISKQLNKRKRRIGIILGSSLFLTVAIGYFLIDTTFKISSPGTVVNLNKPDKPASSSKNIALTDKQNNPSEPVGKESTKENSIYSTLSAQPNSSKTGLNPLAVNESSSIKANSLIAKNEFASILINPILPTGPFTTTRELINESASVLQTSSVPLPNQNSADAIVVKQRKNKLRFQFFFTPTVSYRTLSENKSYTQGVSAINVPYNYQSLYVNVNNAVTHKPDFGFELGFSAKYPLANNLKITGGLQFNVNRYDIKTFNSTTQLATIQLRDNQSLSAITNYNNVSGYNSNWLHNFYFQVSAPIGVELKLTGNSKTQLGIASTIQPTYVLGDRAYLISTDYKNYVEVPWLTRHWNVNTSLETFVAYSTGHLSWQVGPQVRYQLLSSFIKKYPVKENLFDFGLKVGLSLNKQ